MNRDAGQNLDHRLIVLAPTERDGTLTQSILEDAGVSCTCVGTPEQVCEELDRGAAATLIAEESIVHDNRHCLAEWLRRQPPWSDLPVLVIARPGADSDAVALAMDLLGNVTVLERPTRLAGLVSAVRSALRARDRQYQIREHLVASKQAEAALRDADRRKDEFLATLAHELRNPLAPIRNSLHILRMAAGNDPTAERVSEMMERQVNHMVRLVDDLMEVSRITRGLIELRKEETDLAAIVFTAVETSKPLIAAAGHQLAISLPAEPIPLFGDAVRLGQVFANLLNNAAKYADRGGQIWLTARKEDSNVIVSVRDTGIGISGETLPKVFELFMQADRSSKRSQGGLGIGLTLVKRLVEMHGGTVRALSAGIGQGSDFIVSLPIAATHSQTVSHPSGSQKPAHLAQRRVLVVDDNEDAAASMGMLLGFLGADVQVAHDGPTALAAIESYHPDVVLLDIGMPGMDGFEVAQRIRKRADFDQIVLIAMTGWGQAEDRNRSKTAGFDHHLVKPADIVTLQTLLISGGK